MRGLVLGELAPGRAWSGKGGDNPEGAWSEGAREPVGVVLVGAAVSRGV